MSPAPITASAEAIAFTKNTMVFDCLSLFYVLDDKYAQQCIEGGVNACNVTFGSENDWGAMVANIETGLEKVEKSEFLHLVTCAADIEKAKSEGKLGVILGTQGSSMIEDRLERITLMHRLGMRYFGLAYTGPTLLADGCGEHRDAGLTFLGKEAIEVINGLPLILDLSHSGHSARAEATELARVPVCTHSNAYTLNANDRNTKDETAKAIATKGGVVGLCGLPKSVHPTAPTLEHMLNHCDHYRDVIGTDHIGIGLDFTTGYKASGEILPMSRRWRTYRPDIFGTVDEFMTQTYPDGLTRIEQLPNLTQGLIDRGYSEDQVAAILGGNWFNHFKRFVG
ncbi:membrane dipeptidase [Oceaniovalibus sp. ACAM 378]|uniref:membrane dipeptidase n=1 Tax=Oceaniovalibus sp. ACAM 378 TaxID=2599923 RepID=UPI0011D76A7E|nr:membrane dipeptidase [Oceaniovalibus sp. ACAM 378]TYB84328.1 peptidase M19 [Oceaniovalibus sp. ACAM 378]